MSNPLLQRALNNQAKIRESRISSSLNGHALSFSGSPDRQFILKETPEHRDNERTPKNHHNKSSQ